jgi:hypothetical protein
MQCNDEAAATRRLYVGQTLNQDRIYHFRQKEGSSASPPPKRQDKHQREAEHHACVQRIIVHFIYEGHLFPLSVETSEPQNKPRPGENDLFGQDNLLLFQDSSAQTVRA